MRHPKYAVAHDHALELLRRAPEVHVASTTPAGAPVLRVLNAALVGDHLTFHGARAGEKALTLGRDAVVSAHEVVASIPSYFVDAERACPATTLYDSVQAHGPIVEIDDPNEKARALEALMQKYQPEGGYAPLAADSPLYERALAGLLVFAVRLDRVEGKAKLGQNRTPEEIRRIVEGLWQRGAPGDVAAIARILAANPRVEPPARFVGPLGTRLEPALDANALDATLALVAPEPWNQRFPREALARSHLRASAWVGARAPTGELIATAHAVSDEGKFATVMDVVVHASYRGRGVGGAVLELLLDHPVVRRSAQVRLGTADRQSFYARRGFARMDAAESGTTWMVLSRLTPEHG